jgi:M6 family metalloprotease-like protein
VILNLFLNGTKKTDFFMKIKQILIVFVLVINGLGAGAANFHFLPYKISQPNGATINCFVSGDEYFNWLHDQEGYTIIQASDGYYFWGVTSGYVVVPTAYRADNTDPAAAGLKKWAKISLAAYNGRKAFYAENTDQSIKAPHTGTMNNVALYIKFNDDVEFATTRQVYDNKFNFPTGKSLKSYYSEVSYQTFTISTSHYPECALTTNFSYRDTHNRNYFEPYNATANPQGYNGDSERREREHTLLKDAVNWINANSPVPAGLNIDGDSDGNVDNVCFIIRGGNGAWAELLWAHRWSLYSEYVYINGKRVYDYTFQPESQVDVTTLCHEMFHALGSPDLYHYSSDGFAPVDSWDLMESGSGHMGAYMKWKYTENSWISAMPFITTSGTYTLHPLTSAANNCYAIASPYSSSEFFVVEYRKKGGTFENSLPGSGLLVYRIDPSLGGNAGGPPDEVYIYRPGGTHTTNGTPANAYFSAGSHRTKINDFTNPSSFLQNGSKGGLRISQVTFADTTISFTVDVINLNDPAAFSATATSISEVMLDWQKNSTGNKVMIAFDTVSQFGAPVNGTSYTPGSSIGGGGHVIYTGTDISFIHAGLMPQKHYYYKAWSVLPGNAYSPGLLRSAVTLCSTVTSLPFTEGFEASSDSPACWLEDNTDPAWQFIAGNGLGAVYGYPATAHSGLHNACLVDATTAPDYNTLMTPVIDVSGYTDVKLKFWMFMQKWGSRQDELKVMFRTNPALPWTVLQNFTQSVTAWTEQTIALPSGTGEMQIGFCGNSRWALGVCIDDIEISGTALPTLNVSPLNRNVLMTGGTTTFTVSSPVAWTATCDAPSWCTVTPSGTGNALITATYAENPLYEKRVANITVTATGQPVQTATVTQNASTLSVATLSSGGIRIYPNPANGFCRIACENGTARILEISLSDYAGKVILCEKGAGKSGVDLDLSSVAPGPYLVRIIGENETVIKKLSITR